MPISREELWKQLQRGDVAPAYLLFGPETQLRDRAIAAIVDRCFDDGDLRDFNDSTFSLNNEDNLKNALAAAWQLPMMAARRVLRITDVRVSATGYRDTVTENDLELLNSYFAEPSPTSVIIFIADDLNGVRKMGKFLRDRTTSVEFGNLNDDQFGEQAKRLAKEAGVAIDAATMRLLLARVGSDVRRMSNEMNKLAAAALPGNVITSELVEALVPISREISNFDLTDHLVAGRKKQALTALRQMLDDGAEPVMLLGLIGSNYRNLYAAKDLMERGVARSEVVKNLKVPYSKQEPILAAARRTELKKLGFAIRNIAETDLAIKTSIGGSGPQAARMQIEKLVCELALL